MSAHPESHGHWDHAQISELLYERDRLRAEVCLRTEQLDTHVHALLKVEAERDSLRSEAGRAWAEVDKMAKRVGDMTTIRIQDELTHGNIMGRIAIALFSDQNNRTDEECVAAVAELSYERSDALMRAKKAEAELAFATQERNAYQDAVDVACEERDRLRELLREALDAWTGDGPPIELDRIRAALGGEKS